MAEEKRITEEEKATTEIEKFTPNKMEEVTNIKEVTLPLIYEYIKRQGEDDEDWLIDMLEEKVPTDKKDKDGNTIMRKRTFIEQRNAFTRKYFPDLAPKGTSKKTSVTEDILAELKARKRRRS